MRNRVYSAGYRPMGEPPRRVHPAFPIARTMLFLAWKQRSTKLLLLLCLGVFLGHGAWLVANLLIRHVDPMAGGDLPKIADLVFGSAREVMATFLTTQFYVVAFAVAGVVGGCVAEDRRLGAFDLIFARPLSPFDYALGKLLGVGMIPLVTLVIPTLLLWLVGVGIAPASVAGDLWWLIVPSLCGSLLAGLLLTCALVGLSAHCMRSSTVTAVFIAALALGSGFLEAAATGPVDWAGYLAPERNLRTVVDWLCDPNTSLTGQMAGIRAGHLNSSVAGSILGILAYIGAGLWALRLRLRWEVVQ